MSGAPGSTLNDLMSTVVQRVDCLCRERFRATGAALATRGQIRRDGFPAAMLVHGDTSSGASPPRSPHSTSVSRSPTSKRAYGPARRSTPFPEELNRQLIARIAAFHLAPTTIAQENLVREASVTSRCS